ncbi:helix-turn-helix domain-containing protein [Actinacidiphila sp. ITFR-21]|uniref:helix-turn-helix domain-containing protein n=1 Tax=Actinacidiphila sp. ITFR-21 TaxID=3075199 RepID=UPI00288C2A94|nr:helix-turn-helix transcriptional regulator [Streptomyces sp. ITFR-21]WNI15348.1 helix-turn-helix transcriptional regulator [Streptomyces sp. ITFR-21]
MAERDDDERLTLSRVLGNELRRRREARGWSLRDLKDLTTFDHAYLGRVERGLQIPSERLVRILDEKLGTGGTFGDLLELISGGTIQEYQRKGVEREASAERIQVFASSSIPALLQTQEYARARIGAERPKAPGPVLDAAVLRRMDRKLVFRRGEPPPYWAVMDEAALKRPVGSPAVMADQMAAVLRAAENPDVTVQVVPFEAGDYWMLGGSLTLLTTPPGATIAYVESFGSGELVESTKRVVELAQHFDRTCTLALNEEASLELVQRYWEEYQ